MLTKKSKVVTIVDKKSKVVRPQRRRPGRGGTGRGGCRGSCWRRWRGGWGPGTGSPSGWCAGGGRRRGAAARGAEGGKQGGKRRLPDGRRTRTTACAAAASVARVEWARSCASEEDWVLYIRPRLCEGAAARGDSEMLKSLRAEGCPWDEWTCTFAKFGGHLEMLEWLRAEGFFE